MHPSPTRHAFSLVELSIVLVILGLLVGGILAGQSLIRAAELRSVNTEYTRYVTAAQAFRDKYLAIPGDFRDATRFWNLQQVGGNCTSNSGLSSAATPGACDGNGNGLINFTGAGGEANESFQFWRHLALAGLVEGSFSGLSGAAANYVSTLGGATASIPGSRISGAGYTMFSAGTVASGHGQWFAGEYPNAFFFGMQQSASYTSGRVLASEEAWNLDTKMDDGRPATGIMRGWVSTRDTNCSTGTDASATYRLETTGLACTIILSSNLR